VGKISILPDILCNQIAAGEVVERPAAVVKELVENSIDAQSTRISVSLLDGGRREIHVVDNGCGMSPEDALMSIERHATSKIRSAQDLSSISSLGFRGEAIPSIAAVSRFELSTREHDALGGTCIKIEGGVLKDVRDKGCPSGTQVLVRDIFYCVPARRKFLRTAETELAYITDQFLRISLAHPRIHMQLLSKEKPVCEYPRCEKLIQRAAQALGSEIAKSMSPIGYEKNTVQVSGFLAPPDIQRTNSQNLFLYVNGRPVWDRLLQRAVLTSYEALIPRGKYPVAVLFVNIAPALVDVNVHPSKREIRFRNPGEVISVLRDALFEALSAIRPKSHTFARPEGGFFEKSQGTPRVQTAFDRMSFVPEAAGFEAAESRSPYSYTGVFRSSEKMPDKGTPPEVNIYDVPEPGKDEHRRFSNLNLIGQLANSFILLEAPDGLIIIDQHAAHERIVFNGLSKKASTASQILTRPAIIDLMPKEAVLLKGILPSLREIGFDMEPFGGTSFAVHALPAILSGINPEEIIRDYLRYAEEECPATEGEILLGIARAASCHGSVRAGRRLKTEEIKSLLAMLDSADAPFTCPHGRPLSYKLTYEQIYRFFKRS
jgi:DNA mismatch repair protein MutL